MKGTFLLISCIKIVLASVDGGRLGQGQKYSPGHPALADVPISGYLLSC